MAQTTVFLLTGATSFADPGNWNPANNKVECLGSGSKGSNPFDYGPELLDRPTQLAHFSGAGAGGGGYGYATNLNPVFPVTIKVAVKNTGTGIASANDTYWVGFNNVAGNVRGGSGSFGSGTQNPQGGGFYPSGFNGGAGGWSSGTVNGMGGGGAAGPHGVGAAGNTAGVGGSGDGGQAPAAAVGTAGTTGGGWDASHRCGGGGGGGATTAAVGQAGGTYGGGGGGGGATVAAGNGGNGGDGLMVITWDTVVKGTVNITEANDAINGAGTVAWPLLNGVLNVVQQPQIFQGFGFATTIYGALVETHDNHMLSGRAGAVAGLTLSVTQADQALTGRAVGEVIAALTLTQISHTLVGHGIGGVVQESQTLVARGEPLVDGGLVRVQANQALSGRAGVLVVGALDLGQSDQALQSYSGPIVDGKLIDVIPGTRAGGLVLQVDQTLTAVCWVVVGAKLNLTQQNQTSDLVGFVRPFVELAGDLPVTLPFSTPPLTEWQELVTTGITITQAMVADLNVKQMLPLVANLPVTFVLGSTGMTTTVSTDLPTLGISSVAALGPSNLTVTPAVSMTTTTLSASFSLSASLSTFDPTSAIIIDCGTF